MRDNTEITVYTCTDTSYFEEYQNMFKTILLKFLKFHEKAPSHFGDIKNSFPEGRVCMGCVPPSPCPSTAKG